MLKTNKQKKQKDGKQSTAFRTSYMQNFHGPVQNENVRPFIEKLLRTQEEH